MRLMLFALVAASLVVPAAAQTTPPISSASVSGGDQADDPDQQIRCRRMPVTGSLVRRTRACKTVAEWRRLSDRANDTVREQFEDGLICSGGPCRGFEPPPG